MKTALAVLVFFSVLCPPAVSIGAGPVDDAAPYLRDRGPGIPTSMFGTYVLQGELLVYPFYEHYRDRNAEYSPQELGYGLDEDFRGDYEAEEYLIFLGYGLTRDVAIEFEAAFISAELEPSASDPTGPPPEIVETGLGDVQAQVNWQWSRETFSRPGFFSYAEVVFPLQKDKVLIGTQDWEFKVGTGVIRGFGFGTMTGRVAVEYDAGEQVVELGEVAVEYLRRVSQLVALYTGVEGVQDEVEWILEAQIHPSDRFFFKFNTAFGLTSKATDWAPEVGIMFRF